MNRYISLLASLVLFASFGTSVHANTSICDLASGLADAGIVRSKSSCQDYSLDRAVYRQEVAAISQKVSNSCNVSIPTVHTCRGLFADVTSSQPNTWACGPVEALAKAGIITSKSANRNSKPYFRPEDPIKHAEVLAMIIGAAGYDAGEGYDSSAWQTRVAMHARELGIIDSIPSLNQLNQSATRADVFVYATGTLINSCRTNLSVTPSSQGNGQPVYNLGDTSASCAPGSYSSGGQCYACSDNPINSTYSQLNSCNWSCDSGYYRSGSRCVRNTIQCGKGHINQGGSCVSCSNAPSYGYYTDKNSCNWSCDSGYYKYGNTCEPQTNYVHDSICGIGYYQVGSACRTCDGKPVNSRFSSSGSCRWVCDEGYFERDGKCFAEQTGRTCRTGQYSASGGCLNCLNKPSNSVYVGSGHSCNWKCETGYEEKNGKCYRKDDPRFDSCRIGMYPLSGGGCRLCTNAPENAFYFTENTCKWRCESGYYQQNGRCYEDGDRGIYQGYTNPIHNTNGVCSSGSYNSNGQCYNCSGVLPTNAYYSRLNSCVWSCKSGYYRSGGQCVRG